MGLGLFAACAGFCALSCASGEVGPIIGGGAALHDGSDGTGGDSVASGGSATGGTGGNAASGGSGGDGGGTGGSSGSPSGGTGGSDDGGGATDGAGTGATGGTATGGTAGAGALTCTPPLQDCGVGTCIDTSSNLQHCGACNSGCPAAAANATAACAGGCTYSCDSGFAALGTKCATFGGAFATQGQGCNTANCYTGNSYAAGCGCPAGFAQVGPFQLLDDRSCPNNAPPYGWTAMYLCHTGAAGADFAGAYQENPNGACTHGNPYAGGACSCPAGATPIVTRVDGSCWTNSNVVFCHNASAPLVSFGGAYQTSDNDTYGSGGCLAGNPAAGGGCACPAGTQAINVRTVFGPLNDPGGCKNTGAFGANIFVCYVP